MSKLIDSILSAIPDGEAKQALQLMRLEFHFRILALAVHESVRQSEIVRLAMSISREHGDNDHEVEAYITHFLIADLLE